MNTITAMCKELGLQLAITVPPSATFSNIEDLENWLKAEINSKIDHLTQHGHLHYMDDAETYVCHMCGKMTQGKELHDNGDACPECGCDDKSNQNWFTPLLDLINCVHRSTEIGYPAKIKGDSVSIFFYDWMEFVSVGDAEEWLDERLRASAL